MDQDIDGSNQIHSLQNDRMDRKRMFRIKFFSYKMLKRMKIKMVLIKCMHYTMLKWIKKDASN